MWRAACVARPIGKGINAPMTLQACSRQGTKSQDKKVDALVEFVREQISSGAVAGSAPECLLIALSAKSPVVSAMRLVFEEFKVQSPQMRLILATLPENDPAEELACFAPIEVRWAANPRFLDAHEQLVVGDTASWTGDCMRRDPEKRDAFQSFNPDCTEATGWARNLVRAAVGCGEANGGDRGERRDRARRDGRVVTAETRTPASRNRRLVPVDAKPALKPRSSTTFPDTGPAHCRPGVVSAQFR